MDQITERLIKLEQDVKNQKENFASFKSDDFGALKREVHSMRDEFNDKLDSILEKFSELQAKVNEMNIQMAKWGGAFAVIIVIAEFVAKKYI